ncbi:hypothetical protein GW17_00013197 [Ensete ventricosum]|nr:hypothetical protein GW17_00013197 [Ensete ventricosum]
MSSYPSTMLVVLAVRRTFAGRGCRPHLCQADCTTTGAPHTCIRPVARVGSATSAGQLSEGMMMWQPGQHLSYHSSPPREDLLEAPDEGAEDEVLCLAAGSRVNSTEQEPGDCDVARADLTEQELGNCDVARADLTEQELGNCDVARADLTEQELGNCDVARADLTEQELDNCDTARVNPTEQELGNCDVARVDPTEQELENCDVARVDLTEQELGNWDVARADLTEQELRNCDVARADLTEQELGNCDAARVNPTEQELGNCDVVRVDPTEQELGNCDVARVDPTEQELGNYDVRLLPRRFGQEGELRRKSRDLAERVNSGVNPEIWLRSYGAFNALGVFSGWRRFLLPREAETTPLGAISSLWGLA